MTTSTIVPISTRLRRTTGRHRIPIRRQVMDAVQDFSMTATAEARAVRDVLRISQRLLSQTPPRTDLASAHIRDVLPRLAAIIDCGRALSSQADIEAARAEPLHAA